jgi:hypothetical protein
LDECISEGDVLYSDLHEIYHDLKDGGITGVASALYKLKDAIPHMVEAANTCE